MVGCSTKPVWDANHTGIATTVAARGLLRRTAADAATIVATVAARGWRLGTAAATTTSFHDESLGPRDDDADEHELDKSANCHRLCTAKLTPF